MTVQHSLLRRQLTKLLGDPANVPPEWEPLIAAVDQAYLEADSDRRMVERSLDLSSQELLQANAQLRVLLGDLERLVEERTADLVLANQALRDQAADRHRIEEELRHSQKMDAIGRLAGGVAHDFNNLLTVILGYTDRLRAEIDDGRANRDTLKEIKAAAERAAALTKQLLAFSRRQVLQPRILALNDIVQNMQEMLKRLIGENIELVTKLSPDLGLVRADPGQLDQVIVNLVVNARDAMAQGGRLVIETANVKVEASRRDRDTPPGDYVRLAVTDTGCGISAQTQARMFEPFFTSKEAGKGTGLGLATVYGIVKQSEGHISVRTELGKGSTFTITLPRLQEDVRVPRPAAPRDARAVSAGGETILLVEDEEGVRRLARAELEGRGYVVLEAANCEEALARSRWHDGPIHLLLTDVVMPDGSGRFVAERLSAERPTMRVLYMSGYTDSTMLHHGIAETGLPFLQKPFTTVSLAHKVREVIDADRATRHARG
jgi:two-component system cell cycle sensor histidine kinase/response regulator CckA